MVEDPTNVTFVLYFAGIEATSGTMIDARGSHTFNVGIVFCRPY